MNKEFERCCTFLAEMMEKYGLEVLRDIAVELQFDPETWHDDAEGKRLRYEVLFCTLNDASFFTLKSAVSA